MPAPLVCNTVVLTLKNSADAVRTLTLLRLPGLLSPLFPLRCFQPSFPQPAVKVLLPELHTPSPHIASAFTIHTHSPFQLKRIETKTTLLTLLKIFCCSFTPSAPFQILEAIQILFILTIYDFGLYLPSVILSSESNGYATDLWPSSACAPHKYRTACGSPNLSTPLLADHILDHPTDCLWNNHTDISGNSQNLAIPVYFQSRW